MLILCIIIFSCIFFYHTVPKKNNRECINKVKNEIQREKPFQYLPFQLFAIHRVKMVEHVFHPMCVPVTKRTLVSNVKRVRILQS